MARGCSRTYSCAVEPNRAMLWNVERTGHSRAEREFISPEKCCGTMCGTVEAALRSHSRLAAAALSSFRPLGIEWWMLILDISLIRLLLLLTLKAPRAALVAQARLRPFQTPSRHPANSCQSPQNPQSGQARSAPRIHFRTSSGSCAYRQGQS